MITKITGEQPFQVLTNNFSISPSQEGYTLQISADGKQYSNLFSVGAGVTRLVTGVAANSYYRLLGNQSQVSINWMKTCVTEGGSGSGTELTPVAEFPLGAAEGTVVALASGDTVGLYQFIDGEWVLVGADDPTKLLAVNELPASAEPGTVMALYQEGEAGGGTWEWDEASGEYVFNCNFSTLDTAATYDLGSPLGSDVSGCYNYGSINLHYDNGWKVTANLNICGDEIGEQGCENQGGTWICGEDDCNCSLYRTIELSPSTDPNNGFGSGDMCYDEETERSISQRFYWDPADLKLKYVMIDDNDEVTHYRYDCSGVPDLRNITGGTPSEPILGLYQYDGQNWNEIGGVDTEEIELPIAAAVNELKGDFEARLNQQYYKKKEVNDIAARKVEAGQVDVQIKDYVDPAIAEVNDTIEDKELPVSAALNKLNEDIATIDEVIPAAIVDINDRMVSSSTVKTIWRGSQNEYDAITVKDAATLYIII